MEDDLTAISMEFVLGTLAPDERAAFARRLKTDASARAAVADWEHRLAPLAIATPAEEPGAEIWRAVEQRIEPAAVSNVIPLERAVARWRFVATAASALAACLVVYVSVRRPVEAGPIGQTAAVQPAAVAPAAPGRVEMSNIATASANRTPEGGVVIASGTRDGEIRGGLQPAREPQAPRTYVSALTAPSFPAALIVRLDAETRMLSVRRLQAAVPPGNVMRLWLVSPNAAPRPLGQLSAETTRVTLPRDMSLEGASLAASIEPVDAQSATPSGSFAYQGRLVQE